MSNLICKAFSLAALVCLSSASKASVLTFDDLPPGKNFFVADYHGFKIGNNDIFTTAWFYSDEVSPFFSPSSGTTFIATDLALHTGALFESTQAISSTTDFVFDGASFSGLDAVRYELYNNGSLVFTSADSTALSPVSTFFSSGYGGLVDAVVVRGTQGFYVLDDFTYNSRQNVPEPASLGLALMGGALVAAFSRRRRSTPVVTS
ncbi:MAG: PEP-CTERM sorting domain-containing protein [Burkholderiaceae bacterium]